MPAPALTMRMTLARAASWLGIHNMATGKAIALADHFGTGMASTHSSQQCSVHPSVTAVGADIGITVITMITVARPILRHPSVAARTLSNAVLKIASPKVERVLTAPTPKQNKRLPRWRELNLESNHKANPAAFRGQARSLRPPVTAVPAINHPVVPTAANNWI